jgi:hypothetical protein
VTAPIPNGEQASVAVSTILLGQLWRLDETGETWLVTKIYSEAFSSYAMLRKVGGGDQDVRRVRVEKTPDGVGLPGFTFTQETEAF